MRSFCRPMILLAFALSLSACGDDASGPDGGGADAAVMCLRHADCDDGLFCNGTELCQPDDPGADPIGCLLAASPCGEDQICDEEMDRCTTDCGFAPDGDGDGHAEIGCGGDDCDDDDPNRFPGNIEVCDAEEHDEDCDPRTVGDRDTDGDGAIDMACCNADPEGGPTFCGDDCNDLRRDARPGLPEVCDALDNDCDGATDEGVVVEGYSDEDYDLHGNPALATSSCPGLPGFSTVGDDCNDENPAVHGSQVEVCDGMDNDCDGRTDESPAEATWYADADGDLFGNPDSGIIVACIPPAGHVLRTGDCDDGNIQVSPTGTEMCNGIDDDCNGRADYAIPGSPGDTEDDDGDGYADVACGGNDCDDADNETHPGAPETMDEEDNDCDGTIDEAPGTVPWYVDRDGDGYGTDAEPPIESVTRPAGRASRSDDCNDGDASIHPNVPDGCDGIDVDCDGLVDESAARIAYFLDADDDGWGTGTAATAVLACRPPAGTSDRPFDCDDSDEERYPGASEVCNGVDTDCDTEIDEDSDRPWYPDADGDGYGSPMNPIMGCAPPGDYVANMDDCDDGDGDANPMALEDCDGIDDDCDGAVDEMTAAMCMDIPGGTGNCVAGACAISCMAGLGDCNGDPVDGCETDTSTDENNCGACFTACSAGDTCGVTGVGCDESDVVELAAGAGMSFARRAGGRLAVWGDGTSYGAHGAGGVVDQLTPARGVAPRLIQVDAGWNNGVGVTTDGRIFGWGRNSEAQLADGTRTNRPGGVYATGLPAGTTAMHVAAGFSHTCAVIRDTSGSAPVNNVYCWGDNSQGQLGSGAASYSPPTIVPGIDDAQQAFAGNQMSCALRTNPIDGTYVSCWGRGNGGELGDGRGVSSTTPVRVVSLPPDVVELVPGQGSRACVRTASLRVYCWGRWPGDGSGGQTSPVVVAGVDDAIAASQGAQGAPDRFQNQHGVACVIRRAGGMNEVWCWGMDVALPGGNQQAPVPIVDDLGVRLTGAVHIAAGARHACAVLDTGASYEVRCWGENLNGEAGINTTGTREDPPVTPVMGLP